MVKHTAIVSLLLLYLLMNGTQCRDKFERLSTPAELMVLVKSFKSECLRRGINVDISPGSLQLGLGRMSQSGSCKPNSTPKVITIDSAVWKALSPPVKEMLVYHELAHCLLQRKHNNDVLPSGECKSWMREDDSRCKVNSLNKKWRQYYIDELFAGEKLKAPEWSAYSKDWDLARRETFGKIIITKSDMLSFDSSFFAKVNDWEIQVRFAEPKKLKGYLSIKINEYFIHLTGVATFTDTTKSVFTKTVFLDQFKFRQDQNILYTDTVRAPNMEFEFSIRKIKQTVHVFFEKELRASIPFDSSLTLSGYSAFRQKDAYTITVYSSAFTKKY